MFKEFFDKKKLITFDMDGTTVKSEKVWDLAFREIAKTLSVDSPVKELVVAGIYGNTITERWNHIIENTGLKTLQPISEFVELTQKEFIKNLDKLEITEGFWPFVAELKLIKKLKVALVTNSPRMVVDGVIAHMELKEVFDFVICGDDVKNPKPHPEIYRRTLEHFKINAKEALAFEDSLIGCTSAARAGIKIICVWDGETPKRKFPDEVVDYTWDFLPFPGQMDTTYYEDIKQMAEEQRELRKP